MFGLKVSDTLASYICIVYIYIYGTLDHALVAMVQGPRKKVNCLDGTSFEHLGRS